MNKTLEILEKLIAFPTVSADTNLPLIRYLREYLSERGFEIHQIDDPCGTKAGLFASKGPTKEGGILLSSHTDVVPVEDQEWTKDPFKLIRQGDRVYGRGTTDMKGYLASILALADRASMAKLTEPLKLSLSYNEEVGCRGIKNMIGKLNSTIGNPRICIVGEPTSMRVAIGHKGKAAFRAIFKGENGHSAMAPKFVNALHLASDFMSHVRSLQNEFSESGPHDNSYDIPYSTLHIGKLMGGDALNMIPNLASMDFEYRHLAEHDPVSIEARLMHMAEKVSVDYNGTMEQPAVSIEKMFSYPGLKTDLNCTLVSEVKKLANTNDIISVLYGTEAGYFSELGIPTVVCGPGSMDEQGHQPDESIAIYELDQCDVMHDRMLDSLVNE